ncbi:MAG: hypothetical protein NZ108_04580, partial [Bacteroidia bacterium]|nr:hypothetical protein [Bacteroidia bacterium]
MKKYISLIVLFLLPLFGHTNNLIITNLQILGTDTLSFNVSWDNSWRVLSPPSNWDAVWLFAKRKDCAGILWDHVSLSTNSADHLVGAPLTVTAYPDGKGIMIYRSTSGSGNISNVNVKMKMTSVPTGAYDYQVFGIEMVYIPQGSFTLGDGTSTYFFYENVGTNPPYVVSSEAAINMSSSAGTGNLWASAGGYVTNATIPANYPKGFNAFYCMKYE